MAQDQEARDTEQVEYEASKERRDRRRSPWPWIALIVLILIILWLLWQYFGASSSGSRGPAAPVTTTSEIVTSGIAPEPAQPPAAPNELQPEVPDVVGMTKEAAVSAIRAAGFSPLVAELYGTAHPVNKVYHQTPSGGSMLKQGGTVVLQVQQLRSTAPTYVMPRFTDRPKADVLRRLADMGITPTISYAPVRVPHKAGTIASQWPEAGETVARGGDVQIQVFVNP